MFYQSWIVKKGNGTLPERPMMYDEQIGQILSTKMSNQSIRLSFESNFIILCPNFDDYIKIAYVTNCCPKWVWKKIIIQFLKVLLGKF